MEALASNDVEIRVATEADIARITEIYSHHVLNGIATFEEVAPDETEMLRRMTAIRSKDMPWFVAEVEGTVLGYAYAGPFHARSAYRFAVEDSIYLAPEALGKGLGSKLLARLIDACRAKGLIQMMAVIGDSNNDGSIGLHRKFGFRDLGVARDIGFKFGRWIDVVYMQLELQTPDSIFRKR